MSAPSPFSFLPSPARRRTARRRTARALAALILTSLACAQTDTSTTSPITLPAWRPERLPIFFPPTPPPLGRTPMRAAATGTPFNAPPELALYVTETFYPPLGTRLATRKLSDALRTRVSDYRARKLALLDELRAELDTLQRLEPVERASGLSRLSARQTPKLIALEDEQERLRRALVTSDNEWSALREWHLSERPRRGFSPLEIAQVMRAYAYYHDDVSAPQRRLLREVATELLLAAETTAAATAAQPYLFFAPEPARVLLPDDIPADVAARVARFETNKSALKKELYDAITTADGRTLGFLRGNPIKALAERQAPAFVALETLAEEIRRGLARAASPATRPILPGDLDARVTRTIQAYVAAQRDAGARIVPILAAVRDLPIQATYRVEPDGLKFVVLPRVTRGRGGVSAPVSAAVTDRIAEIRSEIGAVADDYSKAIAEMNEESAAIRRELGRVLGNVRAEEIDRRMALATRAALQRESDRAFSEYRTAVFEPGLSPEQRRLLFSGVVEAMQLPLPNAELQPVQRSERW